MFEAVQRPLGDVVMACFSTWYKEHVNGDTDFTKFEWVLPNVPEQPDESSCGIYVCWLMELWNGHTPMEWTASWRNKPYINKGRRKIISRLMMQPENKQLDALARKVAPSRPAAATATKKAQKGSKNVP